MIRLQMALAVSGVSWHGVTTKKGFMLWEMKA